MARPRPIRPDSRVSEFPFPVKNFSKTLFWSFFAMPIPSSDIMIRTWFCSSFIVTLILPLSGVYFMAFVKRLLKTCFMRRSSPKISVRFSSMLRETVCSFRPASLLSSAKTFVAISSILRGNLWILSLRDSRREVSSMSSTSRIICSVWERMMRIFSH